MAEIRIHGASDDVIVVEGCDGADEFNVYGDGKSPLMWRGDLIAPGGDALQIHAICNDNGCWSLAIGQPHDSSPLPEWPLRIRQHTNIDYSVLLIIDAPEGTRLDNIWPTQGGDDRG